MLNEAVAETLIPALLSGDGQAVKYGRINSGVVTNPTLYRSVEQTAILQTGGQCTEVRYTDFIGAVTAFTTNPARGDVITCADGGVYEVRPLDSNTPYKITLGMIRIHTQKIK